MLEHGRLPFISIIIPAYNSQATLGLCLDSVMRLDYPADRREVIVVDNGSTDESVRIAKKYDVKHLFEPDKKSSYAARNKGIAEAGGELLAFTDSDCIATPEWLRHLIKEWEDDSIGCFAGGIEAYQPTTLVERFSDRIGILRQEGTLKCAYLPYTQTANSAYRREVFGKIGPFIPEMTSGGDAEMSWRMQKKLGLKIKFNPEALVYHKHRATLLGLYRQFKKYECGKFSLKELYSDYEPQPFEQRERELDDAISRIKNTFLRDFDRFIGGQADLVDAATPFLRLVMSCGIYSAWVDRCGERDGGASVGRHDLQDFVLHLEDVLSELEPDQEAPPAQLTGRPQEGRHAADRQVNPVEVGKRVRYLAERNRRLCMDVAEKDRQIASLLNSWSWRITAPLRRVLEIVRST